MTSRADQVIAALRSGHDELADYVERLAPQDLTHRSGASEWDVSQVLSHLGSGAEIGLATLTGALDGAGPAGMDFNKAVWARWDAMSPAERAAGFPVADRNLVELYESLTAEQRENLRVDLGFLPQPVDLATAGTFRLNEFALHSWDVKVGFDEKATLAPEAVEPMLELVPFVAPFLGKPDQLEGRSVSLAVQLTDPARSFGLEISDKIAFTAEPPASPDGTLSLTAETWLRLVSGRLGPRNTPDSVNLTSDSVDLDLLRKVFPGY